MFPSQDEECVLTNLSPDEFCEGSDVLRRRVAVATDGLLIYDLADGVPQGRLEPLQDISIKITFSCDILAEHYVFTSRSSSAFGSAIIDALGC